MILEQCRLKNSWTHAHGPIFLLIQLALYHRVDVLKKYEFKLVPRVNLYDFSDRPFDSNDSMPEWEWRSIVLRFALKNYRELAESELTAEGVAEEAFNLWGVHVQGLVADKEAKTEKAMELGRKAEEWERLSKERDGLQAQIKELERQRNVSFGWRFLFRIGWSGLILPGFLALALYTSFVAAIAFATAWHRLL